MLENQNHKTKYYEKLKVKSCPIEHFLKLPMSMKWNKGPAKQQQKRRKLKKEQLAIEEATEEKAGLLRSMQMQQYKNYK